MDIQGKSAAALGRDVEDGNTTPTALTEAFLEAIKQHPDAGRIYARITEDRALAEADAATARAKSGVRRGPLDGVPISWKDLFDSAGTATEAGSALLQGRIPARDALALARARDAGLICLGKTHTTEFAFSGLGLNPVTATPPNAVLPGAAPGGSSSGAAVSTKFGLAAAGIGSDTGGSVRIPAAWNDLVGLKTTSGLIPLDGVVPLCPRFDTIGPLTHTVEDAALLFSVLADVAVPDLMNATVSGLNLLVCETIALEDIEEAPRTAFEGAVSALRAAGATMTRADIPSVKEAMALSGVLFAPEAYATCGAHIETAPEKMFPPVLERFRAGREVSAVAYLQAWTLLEACRAAYLEATSGYDAVLIPTGPIMPPDAKRLLADEAYFAERNLMALRNTRIGNLMGLCALTVPTGVPGCGLMVMAAPFQEVRLLRIGTALEHALKPLYSA